MSQSNPDDAEEIESELQDPDDFHRRQRLKEIHQARKQVHKAVNDSNPETEDVQYAVAMYAIELLPVIREIDDFDTSLPDTLPWPSLHAYADMFGHIDEGNPINYHTYVFQRLNDALAEVRPLIEDSDTDEWEV